MAKREVGDWWFSYRVPTGKLGLCGSHSVTSNTGIEPGLIMTFVWPEGEEDS